MSNRSLISVVVPALNEEENVDPFYKAVSSVLDSLSDLEWEIIFVDDGSTDSTVERIVALHERDPRVCLLQLSRNFGAYAAIKAGLDCARGDAVVSICADLQDPPELLRSFVDQWREGYHIVWGVREGRDDPWSKKVLANLFYRIVRRLALEDLPRDGMDCGLFDRKVVEAFREVRDKNNITFLTIYWMGFRQARIPYRRQKRRLGRSKWPVGKRIKSALDVITGFSFLPVRIASYTGLMISWIAFVGACIVLFDRLVLGVGQLGWPSLMVVILFLGGVQMLILGIIGEYLWRINSQVRDRPQYIVMNALMTDHEEPDSNRAEMAHQSLKAWSTRVRPQK
jgi:glycosyltransferase involved in cell wall biosynthesis